MKSKATVILQKAGTMIIPAGLAKKIAAQGTYFLAGLLLSRASVFGAYSPFSAALAACAPSGFLLSSTVGGIIGYLISGLSISYLRYAAAVFAIAAIRWTLSELKQLHTHSWYAPLIAGIPILATGIAIQSGEGITPRGILLSVMEAVLCGGTAYFIRHTIQLLQSSKSSAGLSLTEMASFAVSGSILLLSLSNLEIYTLSVGRICAVFLILLCSRCGGITGGGICGTICGMVFGLTGSTVQFISGAYAFSGLMSGIFSAMGKFAAALAFVLSNAVSSIMAESSQSVIVSLMEVMVASVLFMILPQSFEQRFSVIFQTPSASGEGMRRSVSMRLNFASKALDQVSDTVSAVSEKLQQMSSPTISDVYNHTIDTACAKCGMRLLCWNREFSRSMDSLNNLTPILRERQEVHAEDFSEDFRRRCQNTEGFARIITRNYNDFLAMETAQRRLAEVRSVVNSQFNGISDLLSGLAKDYEEMMTFDYPLADRISSKLRSCGLKTSDVVCSLDKYDRMIIEIRTEMNERIKQQKEHLAREISELCGRSFSSPCITTAMGECRILLCEGSSLSLKVGTAQHTCTGNQLCGDNAEWFYDGRGHAVCIVSDGMGSGGRAAVDSAMAAGILSRLIKAGLSFDCALKIINSAMMVKAGDETLATLDVACLDLYTGRMEFLKAGAPATYIRHNGKIIKIDFTSLPAGILQDISFARDRFSLAPGDIVLMVSDGATANGDAWIEEELLSWKGDSQSAKALSESIVERAYCQRTDGHDDDITALAAFVTAA